MKIADRYLAREVIGPFFVGVFGFLLIQASGEIVGLLRFVVDERGSLTQVFKILAYRAPQFVGFSLPVAMLFGVCLGINRMARENEVTVMRLSGMALRRIALPLLIVATVVAVISFYINETIAPKMNYRASIAEYRLWFKVKPVEARADVFFGAGPYKFYIGDMQKTHDSEDPSQISFIVYRVMVYELRSGEYPVLFTAANATASGTKWVLHQGVRRELDGRGFTMHEVAFPKFVLDVDRTAGTLWSVAQSSDEMSAAQLSRAIVTGQRFGNPDTRQWQVDYYQKFALPFAAVVLALAGLPLSVHFARGGGFTGILIGLVLFFVYMQSYLLCKQFGASLMPPVAAAWLPNVILGALGAILLWREE